MVIRVLPPQANMADVLIQAILFFSSWMIKRM